MAGFTKMECCNIGQCAEYVAGGEQIAKSERRNNQKIPARFVPLRLISAVGDLAFPPLLPRNQ
jgi:hypothetical protein